MVRWREQGGLLCFVLTLGVAGCAVQAATINAVSCSQTDVQSAIDAAAEGDLVVVPPGLCTWTGSVSIPDTKKITLYGSGRNSTLVTRSGGVAVNLRTSGSRVTGIGFVLIGSVGIQVDGKGWRIDNCSFVSGSFTTGVHVLAQTPGLHPAGLIDHCILENARVLVSSGFMLSERDYQHRLWYEFHTLGSADAVYVETCEFSATVHANAIDSNYGGRYVFRHNVLTDTYVEAHSVQGTHRATRAWEIYNNQFNQVARDMWVPMFLRGGTGVVFNNSLSGTWGSPRIAVDNVRSCAARGEAGPCNGGSPWDGNQPIEAGGTGSHTGQSSASTLTDASKDWQPNAFVGIYVYNLTDGSKGQITANTAQTVSTVLTGGTTNSWKSPDEYKITDGYPCRDQIGRSADSYLWTDETPYPPQRREPVYSWNNTHGANNITVIQHSCQQSRYHIKPERDYFEDTEKPAYSPYPYPHPLIRIWSEIPLPPVNLRVNPLP